jgi:hypothetical protein
MPSSTSSSDSRRGHPIALLLALLTFALIEAGVWLPHTVATRVARYTDPGPDGDALLVFAALKSVDPHQAPPVILLGSSQVREGLDCEIIERGVAGHPCISLAISAGTPLDALDMLPGIDRAAPRRRLVLGLFPKVMHLEPKEGFIDPAILPCLLEATPGQAWHDRGLLAFGLLEHFIPTLRFKDALAAVADRVAGRWTDAWQGRLPPAPQRLTADRDAQPLRYFAMRIGRIDGDAAQIGPYTPAQQCALDRLIAHEAARGSRLIVVDFPTRPGFDSTVPPSAARHWAKLVERLRHRDDLIFVPQADLPHLDASNFLDFTHLNSSGRRLVSERLAEIIEAAAD